jgi:hypothetical protein
MDLRPRLAREQMDGAAVARGPRLSDARRALRSHARPSRRSSSARTATRPSSTRRSCR